MFSFSETIVTLLGLKWTILSSLLFFSFIKRKSIDNLLFVGVLFWLNCILSEILFFSGYGYIFNPKILLSQKAILVTSICDIIICIVIIACTRVRSNALQFQRKHPAALMILAVFMLIYLMRAPVDITNFRLSESVSGSGPYFILFQVFYIILCVDLIHRKLSFPSVAFLILFLSGSSFLITGTKSLSILPFVLYFVHKQYSFKLMMILLFVLVMGLQFYRGSVDGIDLWLVFVILGIVFDASTNSLVILDRFLGSNANVNINIFLENLFVNPIPRFLYENKEVGLGFWRIQADYLHELDHGPFGASYSIGYASDIILSLNYFGLVLFCFVIIVIKRWLNHITTVSGATLFLCINELFRGGFRSVGVFTMLILLVLVFDKLLSFGGKNADRH